MSQSKIKNADIAETITLANGGTGQTTANTALNALLPAQGSSSGKFLTTNGTNSSWATAGSGSGTVTSVSVTTANGVSGSVATSTTTPAISLTLGAITPTSVNSVVVSGSATPTLAVTGTTTVSGANTGDQTITLTGAVTGSGTGSFATTIATPGTLTVATTNSTATAHTHAITSSSAPGAAASLLATDSSGIIGSTGTRIVKGWFADLTVTNAIAADITGNAATATSAAKWTTARNLAGNSVDGSGNVAFANKVILQGTTDAGFSSAQFLGALGTGIVKNTTTTGVLSIAAAGTDYQAALGTGNLLPLNSGGTNANLTASNGGILYSTAAAGAILAGTATASKMLLSGASTTPTWSTSTIPTSAGATANKLLLSDGTNYALSTPTFPNASATSGKIIKSDGTNWTASTETYAAPGTSGNVLTSDGTNWTSAAAAGGAASAVSKSISQANSFTVGQIVRYNGTTWVTAQANSAANAEGIGMVSGTGNPFTLTTSGYVSGLTGLTAGSVYFLDPSVAGGITATEPSTVGQIDKPCFIADSTTSGYFINYRGEVIANALTYATGTFVPNDASGAALTFSTATGSYTRIGNTVYFTLHVVYPATSDVSAAKVGGLPYTSQNSGDLHICKTATGTGTIAATAYVNSNATNLQFLSAGAFGANTNVQLTASSIFVSGEYLAV